VKCSIWDLSRVTPLFNYHNADTRVISPYLLYDLVDIIRKIAYNSYAFVYQYGNYEQDFQFMYVFDNSLAFLSRSVSKIGLEGLRRVVKKIYSRKSTQNRRRN
jgi:hypothetical protein